MVEAALDRHPAGRAFPPSAVARLIALLLPAALLLGAFGSQYIGGLTPCEMCWWQRWAHIAALPFAALSFTTPAESRRARALVVIAALGIAASGAIGVYHAGVEAKVFEGFTTCTASGAKSLGEILAAPLVRCDQIQWSFLGISMAGWNAILSLGGALSIALLLLKDRRT